jgi:hypothetical protein
MTRGKKDKSRPTPDVDDLLNSPFAERKLERELRACETAQQILMLCRYNRAEHCAWYVVPSARHAAFGMRRKKFSYLQMWLASPLRWFDDIYRKGLAVMSGCFVFEVVRQVDDGSLVVIAGKQGRECSVNLAYAVARQQRGAWALDWKGLPEEFWVKLPKVTSKVADMIELEGEYYYRAGMRRAVNVLDAMYGQKPKGEG